MANIKKIEVVQGSIKPINLVARLFDGAAEVTLKNGNGGDHKKGVYFRVWFNRGYDPLTGKFEGGLYDCETPVAQLEVCSRIEGLSGKIREYFNEQFKRVY